MIALPLLPASFKSLLPTFLQKSTAFFDPGEEMNALPRAKEKSRASVPPGFWGRSFFEYAFPDPCPI